MDEPALQLLFIELTAQVSRLRLIESADGSDCNNERMVVGIRHRDAEYRRREWACGSTSCGAVGRSLSAPAELHCLQTPELQRLPPSSTMNDTW